ncbi:MAG: hypothetical protein PHR67_07760 [Candidatus Cloacimonetes bacterium]|nr:hypothetical protein [Candidatus Cloacimonas sp.]MDD2251104.1 hypothetical protein [Candidatus Cloacimonadota bacterium]MDD3734773.1 hypothetical protein [Candidatus Cloacimonadota bacterium]MDD4677490.1 hypothetical protein [Candidatus Cloacimonadota bacterium]
MNKWTNQGDRRMLSWVTMTTLHCSLDAQYPEQSIKGIPTVAAITIKRPGRFQN